MNEAIDRVATPLPFTGTVPSDRLPSNNVTVPVVTGPPVEVTDAVRVTLVPRLAEDEELDRLVVVGSTAVKENCTGAAGRTVESPS